MSHCGALAKPILLAALSDPGRIDQQSVTHALIDILSIGNREGA